MCARAACRANPLLPRGHTFSDYPAASAALIAGCQPTLSAGKTAARFVIDRSRFSVVDVGERSSVDLVDGEKNASGTRISVRLTSMGRLFSEFPNAAVVCSPTARPFSTHSAHTSSFALSRRHLQIGPTADHQSVHASRVVRFIDCQTSGVSEAAVWKALLHAARTCEPCSRCPGRCCRCGDYDRRSLAIVTRYLVNWHRQNTIDPCRKVARPREACRPAKIRRLNTILSEKGSERRCCQNRTCR